MTCHVFFYDNTTVFSKGLIPKLITGILAQPTYPPRSVINTKSWCQIVTKFSQSWCQIVTNFD